MQAHEQGIGMAYKTTVRLALIIMGLFPTLWGLLSLLNNISGFSSTVQYAVAPLLSMTDTYGNPAQTWRAIDSIWAAKIALSLITAVETAAGLMGLLAIIKMLQTLQAPYPVFEQAKTYLVIACVLAIGVWGIGFAVIAGDYFLTWQSESGLATQQGGLVYAVPCFLTLILAVVHKE